MDFYNSNFFLFFKKEIFEENKIHFCIGAQKTRQMHHGRVMKLLGFLPLSFYEQTVKQQASEKFMKKCTFIF